LQVSRRPGAKKKSNRKKRMGGTSKRWEGPSCELKRGLCREEASTQTDPIVGKESWGGIKWYTFFGGEKEGGERPHLGDERKKSFGKRRKIKTIKSHHRRG